MDRVIVWGMGKDFWGLYNLLHLHEVTGDYEIVAYIDSNMQGLSIDGKKVCSPKRYECPGGVDWCIVTSSRCFDEIVDYGMKEFQLSRKCFIKGSVMTIPYFDWKTYIHLLKSNVSIVAEACYGGLLSSILGMQFCSPFVNLRVGIEQEEYYSLLENLIAYMEKTPSLLPKKKYRNTNFVGWEGRIEFPLLWYDDVLLHGFHYENTEKFLEIFEKRRKRFNPEKYVVFKVLYNDEDVVRFQQLPHKTKWGIYYKSTKYDNIITIPFSNICNPYAYAYGTYVFQYFKSHQIFQNLNVFKLLSN